MREPPADLVFNGRKQGNASSFRGESFGASRNMSHLDSFMLLSSLLLNFAVIFHQSKGRRQMANETWVIDEPEDPKTISIDDPPASPTDLVRVPEFPPVELLE